MMVTLPSPNTSRSPSSLRIGRSPLNGGFLSGAKAQSNSAFWISSVEAGNMSTLPTWSPWVCETATYLTSSGFTPTSASCAASVLDRVAVPIGMVIGLSATASGKPVSHSNQSLPWRIREQLSEKSIGLADFAPGDQRDWSVAALLATSLTQSLFVVPDCAVTGAAPRTASANPRSHVLPFMVHLRP